MIQSKVNNLLFRKIRTRKNIFGTNDKPRLNIYRSLSNIYAQIIDDGKRHILVSASTLSGELKDKIKTKNKTDSAKEVGVFLAKKHRKRYK